MATSISNNGLTWSNTNNAQTLNTNTDNWNPNLTWQKDTNSNSSSGTNSSGSSSGTTGSGSGSSSGTTGSGSTGSTNGTTGSGSTGSTDDGFATNPKAELDKDAFLKLLLTELEHQDPTDPMDSDKMLTQTSQLSALEMQQNTNKTMQQMVQTMQLLSNSMSTGMSVSAVNAIGKMATVGNPTLKLNGQDELLTLKMYMPEDSDANGVTLEIYDKSGKLVSSTKSEAKEISKGLFTMQWTGRDNDGGYVGDGEYTAKLVYKNKEGQLIESKFGTYPIEGIKFENGQAIAKMGGEEVPFDQISEISDYVKTTVNDNDNSSGNEDSGSSEGGNSSDSGSSDSGSDGEKA